jgi:hypothetical protein
LRGQLRRVRKHLTAGPSTKKNFSGPAPANLSPSNQEDTGGVLSYSIAMGLSFGKLFARLFGKKDMRILMVGLDAAGMNVHSSVRDLS